jgi:hypothetical protein
VPAQRLTRFHPLLSIFKVLFIPDLIDQGMLLEFVMVALIPLFHYFLHRFWVSSSCSTIFISFIKIAFLST